MMNRIILLALVTVLLNPLNAQTKKEIDKETIKKMCGCFEVDFNFSETFNYSTDSNYQSSPVKQVGALEWVQLVENEEDKIILQHLLLAGDPGSQYIMKHWRQDWLFENTSFYMFDANNKWNYSTKSKKDVEGQWTQKVYQVDDSPRYEGSATWVYVDGRKFWENTTDAPLPRREMTIRKDYNVTVRTNRHEVTANGWIHDQNNDKVIRQKGIKDLTLAKEIGFNHYKRLDPSRCKAAKDWWMENKDLWKLVRKNWDKVYNRNKDLELHLTVDDKRLFMYLFFLDPSEKNKKVKKIINDFIKS